MITAKCILGVHKEELAPALAIRRAVFVEEQQIDENIEADGLDPSALHVLVYYEETPAATGRLLVTTEEFIIGRVAVLPEFRGKKLGDLAVRLLIRMAFGMGGTRQWASVQMPVRGFYEKLGFKAVGDIYEEAGIAHVKMVHEGDAVGKCGDFVTTS